MNQSFFNHSVFLISQIILLSLVFAPNNATAAKIKILEAGSDGVAWELEIREEEISVSADGDQVRIQGMGQTNESGKLPSAGKLIAVPSDSQIRLEIIEQTIEDIPNISLQSTSTRFEPADMVKIGMTGYIRQQRVAQIVVTTQYNSATKTFRYSKYLKAKVRFINQARSGAATRQERKEELPVVEKMLSGLLPNYEPASGFSRSAQTRQDCPPPPPPALKLSITQTGVYALSYSYFREKLGLDLSVLDARQIHMTNQGEAVDIFIAGEEDGTFGSGDVMYFYAQAGDSAYTRTNIYLLSLKADGGARLSFRDATPNPSHPPLTEFKKTVHVEQNGLYWVKLPKEPEKDHLFWGKIDATNSHNMSVNMPHIAPGTENATIRVMMQGRTDDPNYDPDHHTQILLNDVNISDEKWNGQIEFLQEATIPQSSLLEGDNLVRLFSVGDTGALIDSLYVNWLEIDYIATVTAIEDQLTFGVAAAQGWRQFTVGGFTSHDIFVLDVTEPEQIVMLSGVTAQDGDAGARKIQFSDNIEDNTIYYAFGYADKNLLKPAEISIDNPTIRLQSPCNQADYFIIHHDSFDVDALKNLVMGRGLRVMAVPVSDIYDEFNHGMPDPRAIKDFIRYAYENYNKPAPTYVVLVGDANQDLLNELGHGINYVPTNLFYTSLLGVTATDNDFVTVSGDDDFPDMFLGRMPVRSQMEADAVVRKLSRYSQVAVDGWQRNVLFIADNDADFESVGDYLIEKYGLSDHATRIYLSQYAGDDAIARAKQDIIKEFDDGALITVYTGHGSVSNWAGRLFQSSDVDLLDNPDKLTFLMTLNCINGLFSNFQQFDGHDDSLAEAFLKADGKGAVGVWAPTGLGYTFEHKRLVDEFFKLLLKGVKEVGRLTTQAKIDAVVNKPHIASVNLKIFTLFGEPSLQLRLE